MQSSITFITKQVQIKAENLYQQLLSYLPLALLQHNLTEELYCTFTLPLSKFSLALNALNEF